jgi:hypothetical protein
MHGHIRKTTGRPPPVSGPHWPDTAGVSTSAECLSTGLSATLSRKPNHRGATSSTCRGWWLRGARAVPRRQTLVAHEGNLVVYSRRSTTLGSVHKHAPGGQPAVLPFGEIPRSPTVPSGDHEPAPRGQPAADRGLSGAESLDRARRIGHPHPNRSDPAKRSEYHHYNYIKNFYV